MFFAQEEVVLSILLLDVRPTSLPKGSKFSMVAGDFTEVFDDQNGEWDAITTCFFLDTGQVSSLSRIM